MPKAIPLNESRLAELESSRSPFANTIAAALRNVAAHVTPSTSLAAVLDAAADLDSNAALVRGSAGLARDYIHTIADSAGACRNLKAGKELADSPFVSAGLFAGNLDRLALSANDGDKGAAEGALAGLTESAADIERERQRLADESEARNLALGTAERRRDAIANAAALSLADAKQLSGSPFSGARIAARYLAAFALSSDPLDLAGALDAFIQLELQACEKAGEARDATAELHKAAFNAAALRDTESELEDVRSDLNSALDANRALVETNARLEARNATQYETIRGLTAERDKLKQAIEDSGAAVLDLSASALAEQRRADNNLESANALERRAEAADRQLAEYRAACALLPYGMARAYPAAHSLMRVYLADVESA